MEKYLVVECLVPEIENQRHFPQILQLRSRSTIRILVLVQPLVAAS